MKNTPPVPAILPFRTKLSPPALEHWIPISAASSPKVPNTTEVIIKARDAWM